MPERAPVLAPPGKRPRRRPDPQRTRDAERTLGGVTELPDLGVPGRPLEPALRGQLSRRLGRDLSGVRLHHDGFAAELTDALEAEAVTHGDDVYFAASAGDPATPAGRSLLVHELFHSVRGGAMVGAAHDHEEEAEAERAGAAATEDWTALPLTHDPGTFEDGRPASAGDTEAGDGAPPPAPWGRRSRLARRTSAILARRGDGAAGADVPDVVTAGDALVRLVDRLVSRDPADHGGRLRAVLDRLDDSLRAAVLTKVADRSGGHAASDLEALAADRTPVTDGGRSGADAAAPSDAVPEPAPASVAEAGLADEAAEVGPDTPEPEAPAAVDTGVPAPGVVSAPGADVGETPATDEQAPAPATLVVPAGDLPEPTAADAPATGAPGAPLQAAAAPEVPTAGAAPAAESAPAEPVAAAGPPTPGTPAPTSDGAEPGAPTATEAESAAAVETTGDDVAAAPDVGEPVVKLEPGPRGDAVAPADPEAEAALAGEAPGVPDIPTPPAEVAASEEPATPVAGGEPAELEPADPPEITDPPAPENDAQPSLPAPPPPIEEPEPEAAPDVTAGPPESASTASSDALADTPETDDVEAAEPSAAELGLPGDDAEAPVPGAVEPRAVTAAPVPSGEGPEPVLADPAAAPGGGGGGGGGSAIADPPSPPAPDVSGMDPHAALGTVKSLPATKLAASLSGVSAAAQRTVGEADSQLTANPPTMERPSGVPADKDASLPPAPLPPLPKTQDRALQPVTAGPGAAPPVPAAPPATGPPITARVQDARVGGETKISAEDAARIQGAVKSLPTADPALEVDAGPVPELKLEGTEDPHLVGAQASGLADTTAATKGDGLADARADMGENDVLPHVPKETLTADLGGGGAGAGAAPAGTSAKADRAATGPADGGGGAVPDAAVDAIAADQSAAQIDGATTEQGGALGAARDNHEESVAEGRAETDRNINEEIAAGGVEQTNARGEVRTDVGADRKAWVGAQDDLVARSSDAADQAQSKAEAEIVTGRTTARSGAGKAVKDGNEKIVREREDAERKARDKRAQAEKESEEGGFFSWLGSKVTSFFNAIKSAISEVFALARKAVDGVISAAQKLAVEAIELGRKAVVGAIELAGKGLAAAGDIVLAGFPEARAKFRKGIEDRVDAAKKTVNELADKLKAGVTKLLDALGKLLKGALTLLEKAYTAAIDAVAKVVDSAIKAAKAVVDALADFAVLASHIAANPGQWLRNLGASLLDGVRNHVVPALIKAVKDWFKAKVEEVVGVGKLILDVLKKGGISFAKIVTMAWTAIKESLPGILIGLLIEKLIALLIPAAGALALIIDGLRAAWGAASKILAAFQKFMVFLKAVRGGNAGPQFGGLVAAVAVAVIDFLANFVLIKMKGAGQKVGGVLRKLAEKFMKIVKKVAGAVKTGAKAAAGAVKRAVVATGKAIKAGAVAAGSKVAQGAVAAAKAVKKVLPKGALKAAANAAKVVAKQARKAVDKVKATYTKAKDKLLGKKKPKKPKETKEQKIQRAIARTRKTVSGLLEKRVSRVRLWATLKWLKVRWGWQQLERKPTGATGFTVSGAINPRENIGDGISSVQILHAGGPVRVGEMPKAEETEEIKHVTMPGGAPDTEGQRYAEAIRQQRILGIAKADIGRRVRSGGLGRSLLIPRTEEGKTIRRERRRRGGASTLQEAVLNPEMSMRGGDPSLPFVRPDERTTLVPGVKEGTKGRQSRRDRTRDSVHLYEITTVTSFVEGNKTMQLEKQRQSLTTIWQVLTQFPGAKVHYTFIAPAKPDEGTVRHIQRVITGLSEVDRARFTVTWRAIGWKT